MKDKKNENIGKTVIVKNVDPDIVEYVKGTNIPMTVFVRLALKEKMDRDKK